MWRKRESGEERELKGNEFDLFVTLLLYLVDMLRGAAYFANFLSGTGAEFSAYFCVYRDGEFGACFFLEPSSKYPVIYCGRPGSRMWEVGSMTAVLKLWS